MVEKAPPDAFVFIVGSPRSGTTILGELLDRHQHISQWYEPYFVWDHFFRTAPDDERTEAEATPEAEAAEATPDAEAAERSRIVEALRQTGGNRTKAAKLLGTSRVTLWKKIGRYAIKVDS